MERRGALERRSGRRKSRSTVEAAASLYMHILYNWFSIRWEEALSRLDRNFVRVYRSHATADDGGYMPGTAEERLSQVWDLTREVWFFCKGTDAEQRLQRDVAVLTRRER